MSDRDKARFRTIVLAAGETVLFTVAVVLAALMRLGTDAASDLFLYEGGVIKAFLVVGIAQASMYHADLYDPQVVAEGRELFTGLIQAWAATSFVLATTYFCFPFMMIGGGVFLIASILILTQAVAWRVAFEWVRGRFDQAVRTGEEPVRFVPRR